MNLTENIYKERLLDILIADFVIVQCKCMSDKHFQTYSMCLGMITVTDETELEKTLFAILAKQCFSRFVQTFILHRQAEFLMLLCVVVLEGCVKLL